MKLEKRSWKKQEKWAISLSPPLIETQYEFPTAFMADNDIIAVGAMNALKKKGIKIPEEICLSGISEGGQATQKREINCGLIVRDSVFQLNR